MPYRVERHQGSVGVQTWAKFPNGYARMLTADELAVYEYLEHLEARLIESEARSKKK
jgi:hypothetical protein